MKELDLLLAMQDIDENYVNCSVKKKHPKKRLWIGLSAAAACLALAAGLLLPRLNQGYGVCSLYPTNQEQASQPDINAEEQNGNELSSNSETTEDKLELPNSSAGVSVNYVNSFEPVHTDASLVYFTEDELFTHFDTAIFRGSVTQIRNILVQMGRSEFFWSLATIQVSQVLRGSLEEGAETQILIHTPLSMEGVWVEDTDVISQLRVGMEGIFMPVFYTQENDFFQTGGETLNMRDLAPYGLPDGERWAFLDTPDGIAYAQFAYPSLDAPKSLDDVAVFVEEKLSELQ